MFLDLARERYSCRDLSSRPVEEEKIDRIVEAGMLAPTAVNRQPYRILRLKSERAKDAVHKVTKFTFGAPEFLLVASFSEEAWVRSSDGMNFSDVDASIVATHIMLAVKDEGLDTTWVGYFDAPELKRLLPELEPYNLIAIFPIGYANESAEPSERHFIRKPEEEVYKEI